MAPAERESRRGTVCKPVRPCLLADVAKSQCVALLYTGLCIVGYTRFKSNTFFQDPSACLAHVV